MLVPCSQLVVPDTREVQDVMTSLMLTHTGAGYVLRASPEHTRQPSSVFGWEFTLFVFFLL